ncbi:MAG: hypothetical protein Q8K78_10350 [Planctomycetaceae bacterium]|nr:hypothetical protein [Planctomycetaceae bacterium]
MKQAFSPIAVGLAVAVAATVLFWVGFVMLVFSFPDAQAGIGLVLSPCFALWFGGSVGAIVFACKVLPTANAAMAIVPMIMGVIALGVLLIFLGGEIFQMMHPTPVAP